MKRKYLIALGLLLICSIGINIYKMTEEHIPIVSDGSLTDAVSWYSSSRVSFSGVAISLQNKKSNLEDGYQLFSGEIRRSFSNPFNFECELTNTLVLGQSVSVDRPFQSHDRSCTIIQFNGDKQIAIIESNKITFSVNGKNITWQDKNDNGPLVPVFERVFDGSKFK